MCVNTLVNFTLFYLNVFSIFYCQMKQSSLIGKPENLYFIFILPTKTIVFHKNILKTPLNLLATNALTTPSEPESPNNRNSL